MCLVWQIWAIRIAYLVYKRTRKRNNFCILIFMVVMVKVIIKVQKKGPLLFVYQGFQDTICFPRTISLHLGSDLLYLHIHWIDQRVISITWAVIFSFNQCKLEPMNTLFYEKKPTRANVGGMVGEYPASCLPLEVLLESLAQLPSGNMSSGLILFSTSVRFTKTTAGLGTVSWLVGRGPRSGRRYILYVRSEACGEEFIGSVHIGFSQEHVKAHSFML